MRPPAFKIESFVLGCCLLALGTVWTLANLGKLELLSTLRTWWPASLVLWGLAELVNTLVSDRSKGQGS
jgi:hypothetical protein